MGRAHIREGRGDLQPHARDSSRSVLVEWLTRYRIPLALRMAASIVAYFGGNMRSLLACVAIATLSCAVPNPDSPGPGTDDALPSVIKPPVDGRQNELKSGTRLRSRFANGDDGSQHAIGLYDSKLNFECQFAEAEDGKVRCLPVRTASLKAPEMMLYAVSTRSFFKDYNCSERLAFSSLCEPAARYIKFSDTCGGKTRIATALEIGPPSTIYYKRPTDGVCQGITASTPTLTEQRYYTVGAPVNPEEFVSGTIVTE